MRFNSDPLRVREVVNEALTFIGGRFAFARGMRDDLRLILHELLHNAVIHGNKNDREKTVRVRIETTVNLVTVYVEDEGPGFNHETLLAAADGDLFAEGGRGITLVRALSDSLFFNECGNCVCFTKRISAR
jgi:serine/threonine-protein kinase RsbW